MDVIDLRKEHVPEVNTKTALKFEIAKYEIIAIDISFWLHVFYSKPKSNLCMPCTFLPNDIIEYKSS